MGLADRLRAAEQERRRAAKRPSSPEEPGRDESSRSDLDLTGDPVIDLRSAPEADAEQPVPTSAGRLIRPSRSRRLGFGGGRAAFPRQRAYLDAVAPYNEVCDQVAAMLGSVNRGLSVAEQAALIREVCALLAPASEGFAAALQQYRDWDEASDEVATLVSLSAIDAGLAYRCAHTADDTAVLTLMSESVMPALDESGDAASAVRYVIGLPV